MLIELWEKEYPFADCCSSPIELVQVFEETPNFKETFVSKSSFPYEMRLFTQSLIELKAEERATARYIIFNF
jgi:hypothetical protein